MSKKNRKKYTPDVIAVGVVAFLGSSITQEILLMPKREINITGDIKIPLQGILPFSQQYLANVAKVAFNEALPVGFKFATSALDKVNAKQRIKDLTLWFMYDFLSKYSLNSAVSALLHRVSFVDKEKYRDVLRDFIQKLISEKADRDAIIESATTEVVRILRIITEGTLASMIFNERFAEAASGTVAAAIDRFLDNEAAARLTDYLLSLINQLEDVTFGNFLTNMLGLDRDAMGNLIETTYDTFFGERFSDMVKDIRLGDILYDLITNVDYDEVYNYMKNNMGNELSRLSVGGAMAAMSFYSASKGLARRYYKRKDRFSGISRGVKSLFSDKEFLGAED